MLVDHVCAKALVGYESLIPVDVSQLVLLVKHLQAIIVYQRKFDSIGARKD